MTAGDAYGSWSSPLDATAVATAGVQLNEPGFGEGSVLWLEGRAENEGRSTLVSRSVEGAITDLTPPELDVRTRVHEYGGGAWTAAGATAFVSADSDGRLYRIDPGADPEPITPEPESPRALRYADMRVLPGGESLVCVRESHTGDEVVNEIVTVPVAGGEPRVLVTGADFYSFPRSSPEGRLLSWTQWSHPNMPWDETELWVAPLLVDGGIGDGARVAGGEGVSIFQPSWSPDGVLHFVSDVSGFWNIYRLDDSGEAVRIVAEDAEFGEPQWVFGLSTYAFLSGGRIACVRSRNATDRLCLVEPGSGVARELDLPYTAIGRGAELASDGEWLSFVGSTPSRAPAVVLYDPSAEEAEVLRASTEQEMDPGDVSEPRAISFPSAGGRTAHALYHPPVNRAHVPPADELPPLVVESHGGPTGHDKPRLDLEIQYMTTRGIGVVRVNYGGSTGYGRAYRELLEGNWGIVDVEDCVAAARHLVDAGEVDGRRLAIRGGSAGGYTTLCALTFTDEFAAGISYYGVADAATLAADTHKFESRYLDRLIGPYSECADLYRERSPIHFTERLSCPLLLLQGLEDAVVPPSQAEAMRDALRARGIPHAYLAFESEQHGFRRPETIVRALEAELAFLGEVFGFEPADDIAPLALER